MTLQQGTITSWKDDRGFGFITPAQGGQPVFFHISDVTRRGVRPAPGQQVSYALVLDQRQRPRAAQVQLPEAPNQTLVLSAAVALVVLAVIGAAAAAGRLPLWLPAAYIVGSSITFLVYGYDKACAVAGAWRVPEANLHLLELLGGWPGALLAQDYYRHKRSKQSYQIVYWAIVALHVVAVMAYAILGDRLFTLLAALR